MKPIPKDQKLYDQIKQKMQKKYDSWDAYKSGRLVQKYKKAYAEKHGSSSPYIGKRPKKVGLARWYAEDWKSDTGKYKYTSKHSVYRPSKRITSKTPTTFSELSKKQLRKAKREKAKTGRVKKF
mgnify:CR=1 FL=1|tara:strand:+ start:3279 stop:3650 length:372 start_codon:yes stop_codon:yes gene_type:complete